VADLLFFEKPGCVNNTRQKAWLRASGHRVLERNLLTEPWTAERLRSFFGALPVGEWFNPTAPAITRGRLDVSALGEEEAIARMVADPLLIRRPLMEANGERRVGFDPDAVAAWIGLDLQEHYEVQHCPRPAGSHCVEGDAP